MEKFKLILNKILSVMVSALLCVMTLLVLWQVFTRYVVGNPSIFTEELVIIILVWTSFIGASYAFGTREHMALVFLQESLKGNKQKALNVFIDLSVFVFVVIIMIVGGIKITQAVQGNKLPIMGLPRGVIYISMFVSGVITLLYQVINIIEDFTGKKEA
ncbi:TRAP transporter small permease [Treponema pectinovorum]|uniref:TRAP transporter small permease n=1 Tax=Treponema pectinovorum TaxID=164 RepID=UPI0011F133D2|nr:TRAP transporter small permease [Treponema pectinovorum]